MYLYGQSRDKIGNDIPTSQKKRRKNNHKIYVFNYTIELHTSKRFISLHIYFHVP